MNLTPLSVLIAGTGGLLIYCGVYGYDPRDVVKAAIGAGEFPPPVKYKLGEGGFSGQVDEDFVPKLKEAPNFTTSGPPDAPAPDVVDV